MRGSVRHRGDERAGSWEYNVDTGIAFAQRCLGCNKRFWVERKPRKSCPKCGGKLVETEERRRAVKSGFRTRKEAQAAMAKVMVAVEEKIYVAPAKLSVREYLTKEWLPAIKSTVRPTTYRSYEQHVTFHIVPHIGSLRLEKVSGATLNALYSKLASEGKRDGKTGLSPRTVHHVHTCLHRAFRDAVRWNRLFRNPVDAADPPKISGPGGREMKTWNATQVQGLPGGDPQRPPPPPLASAGDDRHAKRRGLGAEVGGHRLRSRAALGAPLAHPPGRRGHRLRAQDGPRPALDRLGPRDGRGAQGSGRLPASGTAGMGRGLDRLGLHLHQGRRHAVPPGGREPLLQAGGQGGQAAHDPPARPAAHPRHPSPASRHPPQGRLRAPRPRHRLDHARIPIPTPSRRCRRRRRR